MQMGVQTRFIVAFSLVYKDEYKWCEPQPGAPALAYIECAMKEGYSGWC